MNTLNVICVVSGFLLGLPAGAALVIIPLVLARRREREAIAGQLRGSLFFHT